MMLFMILAMMQLQIRSRQRGLHRRRLKCQTQLSFLCFLHPEMERSIYASPRVIRGDPFRATQPTPPPATHPAASAALWRAGTNARLLTLRCRVYLRAASPERGLRRLPGSPQGGTESEGQNASAVPVLQPRTEQLRAARTRRRTRKTEVVAW